MFGTFATPAISRSIYNFPTTHFWQEKRKTKMLKWSSLIKFLNNISWTHGFIIYCWYKHWPTVFSPKASRTYCSPTPVGWGPCYKTFRSCLSPAPPRPISVALNTEGLRSLPQDGRKGKCREDPVLSPEIGVQFRKIGSGLCHRHGYNTKEWLYFIIFFYYYKFYDYHKGNT